MLVWSHRSITHIVLISYTGIRVLIYNDDRDLSTNAQGSEMLLNGMKWGGENEWLLHKAS